MPFNLYEPTQHTIPSKNIQSTIFVSNPLKQLGKRIKNKRDPSIGPIKINLNSITRNVEKIVSSSVEKQRNAFKMSFLKKKVDKENSNS